ncbi:MAG TPA: hypothetical protein VFU15_10245 [Bacteroidia bacterium]|nr:hypothetical protein [Bacteroidia bacterium]
MLYYTTPVPRAVFDLIPALNESELKVLLVVIHKTLGWKSEKTHTGRKECDWISGKQFQKGTGLSDRAISKATASLVAQKWLIVMDDCGKVLETPQERKGKTRLYFRLAQALMPATENYSQVIRTKIGETANIFRITKHYS